MDPTRRQALAALSAAVLLPVAGAAPARRETRWLFGGPATLRLSEAGPSLDLQPVWAALESIHTRWNAWKPGGLGPLNGALAQGRWVTIPPALQQALQHAARLEAATLGHFNPAIGALVRRWGFHADELKPGRAPSAAALERWQRSRPSLAHLQWQGLRVRSTHPALQVDLGAYAKGLAADLALRQLQAAGARGAVVDLGGNLALRGDAGGRPWQVGLRDPERDGLIGQLAAGPHEAVVTSGSYERFRVVDGQACSHLLDPFTGQPARELVSATVVHADAALADAAATALAVAGARWRELAARLSLDQALVVHRSGLAEATPRLAARLQLAPAWRTALRVV